jgi:hypothetical protein
LDWLTISVPLEVASGLEQHTEPDSDGTTQPGFKRSQRRIALGGDCWRRFDPREPSKEYGLDYESWEFVSAAAGPAADWLSDKRGRPSRVDVAFDICVDPSMTSDRFVELCSPFITRSTGISGQDGVNTRYVGAAESDLRLRIYRKDLQQGLAYTTEFGPVLRVELIMRKDRARAWWIAWKSDKARAFAAAAGLVRHLCGASIGSEFADLPPLPRLDPQSEVAQRLFTFVKQHATVLAAAHACGLDLGSRSSSLVRRGGRMQRHRLEALTAEVNKAKRHLVLAALDDLLAAHLRDAASDS